MLKPNVKLNKAQKLLISVIVLLQSSMLSVVSNAQVMADYMATPPAEDSDGAPAVMLAMSRDNQLWHKAYSDYSDLDGDGVLDKSYNDNFEYLGIFNSNWCYTYRDSGNTDVGVRMFRPVGPVDSSDNHLCRTNDGWSGNFLNWMTTTRIDVVRRVLYGGYRYVDYPWTAARPLQPTTVLQRAMIPTDNHAFVKIVRNEDLDGFTIADVTPLNYSAGDHVLSFCNVTDSSAALSGSVNVRGSDVPLIKIAAGEHITWAGSEKEQCLYQDEGGHEDFSPVRPAEAGSSAISGLNNYDVVQRGELIVRVSVCEVGDGQPGNGLDWEDEDECRVYLDAASGYKTYKPYGLLQQYGETGRLRFGLITGSYRDNTDGAVLRKKVSLVGGNDAVSEDEEVNTATGVFRDSNSPSIVQTLNSLRIGRWSFSRNLYEDCEPLGITTAQVTAGNDAERRCSDWGNPIGEIYSEAVRYFHAPFSGARAGQQSDVNFVDGLREDSWPSVASDDPYFGDNACENCAIIVLSSGLNDFDNDLAGISGNASLNASAVTNATDNIGTMEGLSAGGLYVVGNSDDISNGECTGKGIGSLSSVHGACPEAPGKEAGYKVAGAAHLAQTVDLRAGGANAVDGIQNIETYALSLSEPLPTFNIPINVSYSSSTEDDGNGGSLTTWSPVQNSISFVPTCQSTQAFNAIPEEYFVGNMSHWGASPWQWNQCSLVDLTVVEENDVYGRYLIAWEASLWGFDHDMDAYVSIEYCVTGADNPGTAGQDEGHTDVASCNNNSYTDDYNPHYNDGRSDYTNWDGTTLPDNNFYRRFETKPEWEATNEPGLQIRISLLAGSANSAMKFGYIINGAGEQDGVYDSQLLRYGLYDVRSNHLLKDVNDHEDDGDNIVIWDAGNHAVYKTATGELSGSASAVLSNFLSNPAKSPRRFTPGDNAPSYLKDPLWYAVKYGNSENRNGDGTYAGGDPEGYFQIKNPSTMKEALSGIFENLAAGDAAATAPSVNMRTSSGEGFIVQALYTPRIESSSSVANSDVQWAGSLHGLFVGRDGRFYEDNNRSGAGRGTLGDEDSALEFNSIDGRLTVTRTANGQSFGIDDDSFSPIWSASEMLAVQVGIAESRVGNNADPESTSIDYNRSSYTDHADNGRYIFTSINRDVGVVENYPFAQNIVAPKNGTSLAISPDNPGQGVVGSGTTEDVVFEFTRGNFDIALGDHRYFDHPNDDQQSEINALVDYISGIDRQGLRNRTISNGVSNGKRYVLGDIVNSSPAVVGRPTELYETYYDDASYAAFKEHYRYRRNVVYVGANDGMLHAFNAGFFDANTLTVAESQNGATGHPLGAELWAYVPFNLLPHLKWLSNPDYGHVYYVDGPVQSFDVKLWPENDSVHVGGWGTIIVAGMRFGGGPYSIDNDGDATTPSQTLSSAYIVMDVTDPERPPELIAEISHPQLGFTSSLPTVIKGDVDGSGTGDWHLVFGSGPKGVDTATNLHALTEGVSYGNAYLFTYDLTQRRLEASLLSAGSSGDDLEEYAFVGGITAADWDEDYTDDVVYFGIVSGNPETVETSGFGGKLKRGVINFSNSGGQFSDINNLYDAESLPFSTKPYLYKDRITGERWIYAGTGRYMGVGDNRSNQQNSFYGLKEPLSSGGEWRYQSSVREGELVDTTNIVTYTDGTLVEGAGPPGLGSISRCGSSQDEDSPLRGETFGDLQEYIEKECSGWKFDFFTQQSGIVRLARPGIRNIQPPLPSDSSLLVGAFEPEATECEVITHGYLFAPHRSTGVAAAYAPLGTSPGSDSNGSEIVNMGASTGEGNISYSEVIVPRPPEDEDDSDDDPTSPEEIECHGKVLVGQSDDGSTSGTDVNCEPYPPGRRGWAEIPVTW